MLPRQPSRVEYLSYGDPEGALVSCRLDWAPSIWARYGLDEADFGNVDSTQSCRASRPFSRPDPDGGECLFMRVRENRRRVGRGWRSAHGTHASSDPGCFTFARTPLQEWVEETERRRHFNFNLAYAIHAGLSCVRRFSSSSTWFPAITPQRGAYQSALRNRAACATSCAAGRARLARRAPAVHLIGWAAPPRGTGRGPSTLQSSSASDAAHPARAGIRLVYGPFPPVVDIVFFLSGVDAHCDCRRFAGTFMHSDPNRRPSA